MRAATDGPGNTMPTATSRRKRTRWASPSSGATTTPTASSGMWTGWDASVSTPTWTTALSTEVWKNEQGATVNTITYTYDENNQLLTAGDNNGTYTFTYDPLGRMATQQDPWGNTLTFGYDLEDHLATVDDSKGGHYIVTYVGDLVHAPDFHDGTSELSVVYGYDGNNQLTSINRYNDTARSQLVSQTVLVRDIRGDPSSITHKTG